MSEEFKKKLEQYAKGELSEMAHLEMESELEKIEIYQQYLSEIMGKDEEGGATNDERKLIRRGKWKSRIINTLFTLSTLTGLYILILILGRFYFHSEDGDTRAINYSNVMGVAFETTIPNVTFERTNYNISPPFTLEVPGQLLRRIGSKDVLIEEVSGNFFFSSFDINTDINSFQSHQNFPQIIHPDVHDIIGRDSGSFSDALSNAFRPSAFQRLEQVSDGTVAELYLSFTELKSVEDVIQLFEGYDLSLRWFGVDSGITKIWDEFPWPFASIGFHGDSHINRRVDFEERTRAERHERWMLEALRILQDHPNIANTFLPHIDLNAAIAHIEENGVKIMGVVVTGPTNELLSLKDEAFIAFAQVGEIDFWNWTGR